MILMVACFAAHLGLTKWDMLDDGDDCLLICEKEDLELILGKVHAFFLEFGHEIKVEHVAHNFEQIIWCQSSPINYEGTGWKFVRNPWKVMMNALGGSKWATMPLWLRRSMINTIGVAELVLNLGVPVLQNFALALMRNSGTQDILDNKYVDVLSRRVQLEVRALNDRCIKRYDPREITTEARLSFMKAFDVTLAEQVWMEKWLDSWEFAISGDVKLDVDVVVEGWYRPHGHFTADIYHYGDAS